jgi:hypothetical protein
MRPASVGRAAPEDVQNGIPRKVKKLLSLVAVGFGCGSLWEVVKGALHEDGWRDAGGKAVPGVFAIETDLQQEQHPVFG